MDVVTSGSDVMSQYSDDIMQGSNGSVNGEFVERRNYELAVARYHKPYLKSLQYDMHRY